MATKNLILENIEVLRAGAKGISIGKTEEGKTIMIKNAVPGDVVTVQVRKRRSKYYEAEVVEFHTLSPFRTEPKCEHFGTCGGCKWQNMHYSKQLEIKESEVLNNIQRIAGITDFEHKKILGSSQEYLYRNKMEFSFSNAKWLTDKEVQSNEEITNKNALGFHIPGMWSKILDLNECFLQQEPSNSIRLFVKKYAEEHQIPYFDVREHSGVLRTLMLKNTSDHKWMVVFQLYEDFEAKNLLFDALLKEFPEIETLLFAINPKPNDSIYDLDIQTYSGSGFLMEKMEDLQFKISPKSFFQTNYNQAVKLYELTREYADLQGDELVYDLYTGTGTIAQFISKKAKKVVGIESVPEAIEAAKENAKLNNITNCDFFCGDMKDIFNEEFIAQNGKPNVIITDPPRDGMHKKVVENMLNLEPQKIVYVSCNSATQARDLDLLKEKYKVTIIHPVDMFPQTHHVENIAVLTLK